MKGILWEQRVSGVVSALLTAAAGGFLLFWPDRSVDLLCSLLGAALLVIGLAYVLGCLARRRGGVPMWFLIPGIILAALGLWLMKSPSAVMTLVQYAFAAMLIFHGVLDVQGAISLARLDWPGWGWDLLLAALTLVLGGVIFCNPMGSFSLLVMVIGVSLIFDGISDLVIIVALGRADRRFRLNEESRTEEQPPEQDDVHE